LTTERTEYDALYSFKRIRVRIFTNAKTLRCSQYFSFAQIHKRHGGGGGSSSSGSSGSSGHSSPIFVRTSSDNNNDNRDADPETIKRGNKIFWTLFAAMAGFMLYSSITAPGNEDERERATSAHEFLKQNPPKKYRLNAEVSIFLPNIV